MKAKVPNSSGPLTEQPVDGPPAAADRAATRYLDFDDPTVAAFVEQHARGRSAVDRAVSLFYAVRDGVRYDPYVIERTPDSYRASYVLARGRGFCVQKAVLLAAAARCAGIAARPGFADVRNHLTTPQLKRLMSGSNLFVYHGYVALWLHERWIKATPAFNLSLCRKFHVLPLDFDGRHDTLFHPYDAEGRKHMEYITEHGCFSDLPFARMVAAFAAAYPKYFEIVAGTDATQRDFARQAEDAGGTA
jgi:transglutaminase-like putative cysteine protease